MCEHICPTDKEAKIDALIKTIWGLEFTPPRFKLLITHMQIDHGLTSNTLTDPTLLRLLKGHIADDCHGEHISRG